MYGFLQSAIDRWNESIQMVLQLLGQSPQAFQGGEVWAMVNKLYPMFVAIGVPLVVLFFMYSLASESIDIKKEFTLENTIKMLIRLCTAEWLVANGIYVINTLFESVGALFRILGTDIPNVTTTLPGGIQQLIESAGFMDSILAFVVILILTIGIFFMGYYMLFIVYTRFFKIYLGIILAPIALAPLAGTVTSNTPRQFGKYMINVAIQSAIMIIAIIIYTTINSSMKPMVGDSMWTLSVGLIQIAFGMVCTVGGIKGAEMLANKYLGL